MSDTMRYWLGLVCRDAREERGRLQVHVAASLDRHQSTIARFERGEGWPREPDLTVAAYADDLDMQPIELWSRALDLWSKAGDQATLIELKNRTPSAQRKADQTPGEGRVVALDALAPEQKDEGQARPAAPRKRNRRRAP